MKSINLLLLVALSFFTLNSCNKDKDPIDSETTSVHFYKPSLSLAVGGREKIMLTLNSMDAALENAKWSASDTNIVKVDADGVVKAIAAGDATISLSANNNISGKCKVKVITSPITSLIMPETKYPIAKDAIVFLQGNGFTKNSRIILRSHSDYNSTLKSAADAGDILVQINEQALNYLSFYAKANPGWYNIVLDENGQEFDLGNIVVETPNLSNYEYDKTKIFWDDTHWRWLRLRGKVKEMKVNSIAYSETNYIYRFSSKGFVTSNVSNWGGGDSILNTYDDKNRLISKTYIFGTNSLQKGMSDPDLNEKCTYKYGDHSKYYIINSHKEQPCFESYWEGASRPSGGLDEYLEGVWVKGLIGIESSRRNYNISVTSNSIVTTISKDIFTCSYDEFMPYKSQYLYPDGTRYENLINYSSSGLPLKISINTKWSSNSYNSQIEYVEDSPFHLYLKYDHGNSNVDTYEYDKNWNVIKVISSFTDNTGKACIRTTTYNYMSYDEKGNWTQCVIVEKVDGWVNYIPTIRVINKEFVYW